MLQLDARVLENRAHPRDIFILTLEAPSLAPLVRPGQFIMASIAHGPELPAPLLKRALAVYTIPDRWSACSRITVLIKSVGEGTRRLTSVRAGDVLELVGPLGNGFDLERAQDKTNLLVAGGTGIASLYLLAENLVRSGEKVHLIYGGRKSEDLAGFEAFESLGLPVELTTEDGSRGIQGLVTAGLRKALDQHSASNFNIYTCGPNPMMRAVTRIAIESGIPCQISVEVKMGCGFGVCLGCTVKTTGGYRLACKHGPVFEASEFVWEPTA